MENIRTIQPVTFWHNGVTIAADHLQLHFFGGYNFTSTPECFVIYRLGTVAEEVFTPIIENSVQLPTELVATWGEDDEPIWQYVLTTLNLIETE